MGKQEVFEKAAKSAKMKAVSNKVAVNLKEALQASLYKIDPTKTI